MPEWVIDPFSWSEILSHQIIFLLPEETGFYVVYMLFYFLPYLLARIFDKKHPQLVFWCNLLLGHVLVTWLIVLALAILLPKIKNDPIAKPCHQCKELIRFAAKKCRHCHSPCKE